MVVWVNGLSGEGLACGGFHLCHLSNHPEGVGGLWLCGHLGKVRQALERAWDGWEETWIPSFAPSFLPQNFAALLCRASQTLSVLLPASQSTGGTVKDGTCFPRPRWDVLLSIMAMLGLLDPGGLKQGLKRGEKKGKCLYFFLTNCQGIFGTFHSPLYENAEGRARVLS